MIKNFLQKTLRLTGLRREKAALESIGRRFRVNSNTSTTPRLQICRFFSSESGSDELKLLKLIEDEGRIESAASKNGQDRPQADSYVFDSEIARGQVDFEAFVLRGTPIVDKSLFIKAVLESDAFAILFTRPRRWGKTLNITMLKSFLEIGTDKNGRIDLTKRQQNRVLFEGAEEYDVSGEGDKVKLKKLKICFEKDKDGNSYIEEHQGRTPVIFITFRSTKIEKGSSGIFSNIKLAIREAFEDHFYLVVALEDKIKEEKILEKKYQLSQDYEKFLRLVGLDGEQTDEDLKESLSFLSKLLHDHFKQKVFLLIDEYDTPLNSLLGTEYYNQVLELMREIFTEGIKNNKNAEKVVLTGILRIAKESLFSGVNNMEEYGVLDEGYAQYFGFIHDEVTQLTAEALKSISKIERENILEKIKHWYNGYNIGIYTLYNPWSIAMCLSKIKRNIENKENYINSAFREYWISTGNPKLLVDAYEKSSKVCEIDRLISEKKAILSVSNSIDYKIYFIIKKHLTLYLSIQATSLYMKKIKITKVQPEFVKYQIMK